MFPAGILQPPFFDPDADPAVNYGGIGGGHRPRDQPRLRRPGPQDRRDRRAARLVDAGGRETLQGRERDARRAVRRLRAAARHAHQRRTDAWARTSPTWAACCVALDAYHTSLDGKPAPVIDGLTGDQRCLPRLGAGVARQDPRRCAARSRWSSDPHSPGIFRVNGPIRNVDGWYAAFDVKPGDKYYLKPDDRVHVW